MTPTVASINPTPSPTSEPLVVAPANDNDTAVTSQNFTPAAPQATNDNDTTHTFVASGTSRPLHTHTESTLAPTSEFMRYFLAALPSRYVLRGLFKTTFGTESTSGTLRTSITNFLRKPGAAIERAIFKDGQRDAATIKNNLEGLEAGSYGAALGLGSMALTASYSSTVYRDIKNLYAETVAAEFDKPVESVNFNDIKRSQNTIIQGTLKNFRFKMATRFASDLLFFPAAWMRHEGAVDFVLGLKGVLLFTDTWKRKTTMFEDLVSFVNNKINPHNGLGQPIAVGEIFDLYQHYSERYHPGQQFANVLESGTGEGARWAQSQPIFQRLTELMNLTYAYKHASLLGDDGHTIKQADFTLPKFIYLLGNDLIDVTKPEQTLATIEIANRYGIPGVKQMRGMLAGGAPLEEIKRRLPYAAPPSHEPKDKEKESDKNGVIAKGSTLQLDTAPHNGVISKGSSLQLDGVPGMRLDARSIEHHDALLGANIQPNLA